MKVRIGIDVGGTFTDAVAINNDTYELIGYLKIPTTHSAKEGVASGIVQAIDSILKKYNIAAEDVVFIAHGTTQATNALLEGDVAKVGIVGIGTGGEGLKAKADTTIGNIELADSKFLYTDSRYVDYGKNTRDQDIDAAVDELTAGGAQVIVASGAFSVDDPSGELAIMERCQQKGILSTGSPRYFQALRAEDPHPDRRHQRQHPAQNGRDRHYDRRERPPVGHQVPPDDHALRRRRYGRQRGQAPSGAHHALRSRRRRGRRPDV